MKRVMYAVFALVMVAAVVTFAPSSAGASGASDFLTFSGELKDGQYVEILFVKSTRTLGIAVKNKEGRYVSGYIFRDVVDPQAEFNLSSADLKFGEGTSLGNTFWISSFRESAVVGGFDGATDTFASVASRERPFGECRFWCYDRFNWHMCFMCCIFSSDC